MCRFYATRTMEALRHEHSRVLFKVKDKAVWIPNLLVDVTRHRGETEMADHLPPWGWDILGPWVFQNSMGCCPSVPPPPPLRSG